MRRFLASLCAIALLVLFVPKAQTAPVEAGLSANPRVALFDTGWIDVAGDNTLAHIGNVKIPNGGVVIASLEFRYAYEAENLYGAPVDGYQVGYGFEYHVGDQGRQVCSNSCGGALGAGDGSDWTPPTPWPSVTTGFYPGSDHHYIPNHFALPVNLGVFQPGTHSIDFAAYGPTPQQWGDELNPEYPTHVWEVKSCYTQMRVRLAVAN